MTKRRIPAWRKMLYAAFSVFAFWLMLELVLFAAGVQPILETEDPFVGFSKSVPLMLEIETATDKRKLVTRPSKLPWFNRQLFAKDKSATTKRIVCVGGSTTFGRPYSDTTSYCGWLREILPLVQENVHWEVINAGGISYASYRVAAVMEELAQYEPDLFIVYSAHNEFLENRTYAGMRYRSRVWRRFNASISRLRTHALFTRIARRSQRHRKHREILPPEVDERLNKTIGPVDYSRDADWHAKVVNHYELNIRRMVAIAHEADAEILFVTPASNERDCSPFKSQTSLNDDDQQDKVKQLLADGLTSRESGDGLTAIKELQQAKSLDPLDATIRYELGRTLFAAGKFADARSELLQAINEDVCPLRATDQIKTALRETLHELDAPFVDFENRLRNKSLQDFGHDIMGAEYFLDHVHPTIDMHQQLAIWIIERLMQREFTASVDLDSEKFRVELEGCTNRVLAQLDTDEHGIALRNLAKVIHWSGKFEESARIASDALELIRNDAESRFILADSLKNLGRPLQAIDQYAYLLEDHPDYVRAFLPYGELLMDADALEQAADLLALAQIADPENSYLHLTLGRLQMKQGNWKKALEFLNRSVEIDPVQTLAQELIVECTTKAEQTP